ncbi:MAG TPA: AAA family ATPase [Leptospiraceae bacterium]|nr:AAA family ATPase [Leptospiraceae bacterium]HNN04057.1 AAA family ATPase [Leptospiraceae bacterium]
MNQKAPVVPSIVSAYNIYALDFHFYSINGYFPISEKHTMSYLRFYLNKKDLDEKKDSIFLFNPVLKYLKEKYPQMTTISSGADNGVSMYFAYQLKPDLMIQLGILYYLRVEDPNEPGVFRYQYCADAYAQYSDQRILALNDVSYACSEGTREEAEKITEKLWELREETPIIDQGQVVSQIGIICKTVEGVYYIADKEFTEHSAGFKDFDLDMHYGEGFTEKFHRLLVERLKTRSNGIVLFHGSPGTGKTFYIRRVIRELYNLPDKKIIIVPNTFVKDIATPEFFNFLYSYIQDNFVSLVLVIEDAENILKKRSSRNSFEAISNILNMTDGLLNDFVHIQIVATFNTELENIDTAILRHKRLLARKEFQRLGLDAAKKLAKSVDIPAELIAKMTKETYSLAEIFSLNEQEADSLLLNA